MLYNYFKTGWRSITRHKGYSVINILGLALGICAALVIYLVADRAFSFNQSFADKDRIYRIVAVQQDGEGRKDGIGFTSNPLPAAIRSELNGFETVTGLHHYYASVAVPAIAGESRIFDAAKLGDAVSPIVIAEPQYFNIFKYQWLAGNPLSSLQEPYKVVLTQSKAIRYFGSGDLDVVIGKTIIYRDVFKNDSLQVTVSGIVKDQPGATDLAFTDFISFSSIKHSFLKDMIRLDHWANWNPHGEGYVKLAKGVRAAQVEKQLATFVTRHVPPYPGHTTYLELQPLSDLHFNSQYRDLYTGKAHKPTLYALMGIAVFILLIAAINFINLSTAQAQGRAREIGVRKVLGSNKSSLQLQFLGETFIITSAAVVLALVMVYPALRVFPDIFPTGSTRQLMQPRTLLFIVMVTIFTTLLAGIYPAKVLAGFKPATILKGTVSQARQQKSWLRQSLIVFQFTVSLVFIICTLVVGNQLQFIVHKDLGFTRDAIVTLKTGYNQPLNKVALLSQELKQLSGVGMVSQHMETPAAKSHAATNLVRTDAPQLKADALYEMCDENYIPLFGLSIIAGRNILHSDTVREIIINETAVKQLHYKNPEEALGKPVRNGMNDATGFIVGVVKDFHAKSLHEPIQSFFLSSDRGNERAVSLRLSHTPLSAIEHIWKSIYPDEKFSYTFLDETIARLYTNEQKTSQLMNTAMATAIFISCIGLFGLAAFTTGQRTREIGVRKVLGATIPSIVSLLSRDFIKLNVIAMAIATPLAYFAMDNWLQDFAYRVSIGPWVFAAACGIAIVMTLLAIGQHTIKAALENPVKSLRNE